MKKLNHLDLNAKAAYFADLRKHNGSGPGCGRIYYQLSWWSRCGLIGQAQLNALAARI